MRRLSWNLGALTPWNSQGLSRPVQGLLYLYLVNGLDAFLPCQQAKMTNVNLKSSRTSCPSWLTDFKQRNLTCDEVWVFVLSNTYCMHTDFFFVLCVSTVDWLNVMILGCWGFYGPLVARGADALTTEWTVTQDPKNEIPSLKTYFDTSVCPSSD